MMSWSEEKLNLLQIDDVKEAASSSAYPATPQSDQSEIEELFGK